MGKVPLSEQDKLNIISLYAPKIPMLTISKKIKKPESTVRAFIHRYRTRKTIQNRSSPARKPKQDPYTRRRIIRTCKNNRFLSCRQIKQNLSLSFLSVRTIMIY